MAGRGGQPSSRNIEEYIKYVKDMIERCLQCHKNQQDAEQYLETHFQIQPDITRIIWQQLEEENKEFFRSYHVSLRQRQMDMMQQMQTVSRDIPQPDSNAAPPMSSAPSVPKLQPVIPLSPYLSNAQRNKQPATVPVPNLRAAVPLLPDLNVAPHDDIAVTVPVSGLPNWQPDLNIATRYNQAAVVPDPRILSQQHQVLLTPISNLPGNNPRPSSGVVLNQLGQIRTNQRSDVSPQHGFGPSQAQPQWGRKARRTQRARREGYNIPEWGRKARRRQRARREGLQNF